MWCTRKLKPLFSEKANLQSKLPEGKTEKFGWHADNLSEIGKVISDDKKAVESFKKKFVKFPVFKFLPRENYEAEVGNDDELILNYMNKYRNHLNTKFIKVRKIEGHSFLFMFLCGLWGSS